MKCLACKNEMINKGSFEIDSERPDRKLFDRMRDREEHLIFEIHVCEECTETRFKFRGTKKVNDK